MMSTTSLAKKSIAILMVMMLTFSAASSVLAPSALAQQPKTGGPPNGMPGDDSITLDFGQEAKDQELPGSANTDPDAPGGGFAKLIGSMMSFVMTIAAILGFLYMIWGAIEWISAVGDSGKIEKARQKITQSILGLVVLSATIAIFMMVQQFLGICVLPFFGACSGTGYSTTFTGGGGSGGSGGGSGGGSSACVVGTSANDGGAGNYCTQGAAIVECHGPDSHPGGSYSYNHYDPCSCVNGAQYQKPGYDFSSC